MEAFFGFDLIRPSVDPLIAQQDLIVNLPHLDLLTLLLYNVDESRLHFLEINIRNADVKTGQVLLSYLTPGPGYYQLNVYQQSSEIPAGVVERQVSSLEDLTSGLRLVGKINFMIESGSQMTSPMGSLPSSPRAESSTFVSPITETPTSETPRGPAGKEGWFFPDADLTDQEKKYCRCTIEVAGKQPAVCNSERAWFQSREGKKCYNPYAVCAKSTRTTSRNCGSNFDFSNLPDNELIGYASLNRVDIPRPYNRQQLLSNIELWKSQMGK